LVEPHVRPALRGHGWQGPQAPPPPTAPFGSPHNGLEFNEDILSQTFPSPTRLGPTFKRALAGFAVGMRQGADDIVVDWDALRGVGVAPDAPVDLAASGIRRGDALMSVLAAADPVKLDAGFGMDWGGVIHVTTRERLDYNPMYEYDVADLLPPPDRDAGGYRTSLNALTGRIESEAAPGSWIDRGGRTGAIAPEGTKLLISQTTARHEQVAYVLERLRWRRGLLRYIGCIFAAVGTAGVLAFATSSLFGRSLARRRTGFFVMAE
jgi:hypothetical protein